MNKIGLEVFANSMVKLKNVHLIYVEDDIKSIEQRMQNSDEEITLTIASRIKDIAISVKKADIQNVQKK
mgnify:CR=1 FL=1